MFDIGVNLTSSQFAKDVAQVVERAREAGVTGMLITGTDLPESEAASALAQHYRGFCWSTAGVHPHQASGWSDEVAQQIGALAAREEVVAIGECGLDFNRNFSTPQEQEAAFSAQLALAAELELPVFLHCRDAHGGSAVRQGGGTAGGHRTVQRIEGRTQCGQAFHRGFRADHFIKVVARQDAIGIVTGGGDDLRFKMAGLRGGIGALM